MPPVEFRWGVISTGRIATCFVKVSNDLLMSDRDGWLNIQESRTSSLTPKRRYQFLSKVILAINIIFSGRRDVEDVAHKLTAVGSRSTESAQRFIKELAGDDLTIKAYGSYDEVFADKVCFSLVAFKTRHKLAYGRTWMECTSVSSPYEEQ